MPTDRRWVEENLGTAKGGQSSRFGKPLIPADQNADRSVTGLKGAKAQISGREVELFVVQRVVGNMHLAVQPDETTVGIEHTSRVVVDPGGAPLEDRTNDDDFVFASGRSQSVGGRSGNRLSEIEIPVIFTLTEIARPKELGEANNLRSLPGRLRNAIEACLQVAFGVLAARHLHECDTHAAGL